MKTHKRILKMAPKLWPGRHGRFRQMCALAVTGQLGGPQMFELNAHLPGCDSCREFLESVAQTSVNVVPGLAGSHTPAEPVSLPIGMRARFLSRLAAEADKAELSAPLVLVPAADKPQSRTTMSDPYGGRRGRVPNGLGWSHQWSSLIGFGAALAACAIVGVAAFDLGHRNNSSGASLQPSVSAPTSQLASPTIASDRIDSLQEQKVALANQLARATRALSDARAERRSLSAELAAARARLAAYGTAMQTDRQGSDPAPQSTKSEIAATRSEVEVLTLRLADSEARAKAERKANDEMTAKLAIAEADLDRERELQSAKTEVSDLVGARNLHIVDVYDSDGSGKRQRAFGRVFYTEGKSLVFYAYDLQDPHRVDANVVFHVWGEKAGIKTVTHSLGLLHNDDPKQGRWTMTFDDRSVLAQINSVFVTMEVRDKPYNEPRGKKVLYAYFGSAPNHP